MIRFITVLTIIIASISTLIAQPISDIPYNMKLDAAEEQMALRDYYNALEFYEDAYKDEQSPELRLQVAYVRYLIKDYERANKYYNAVLKRDEDNLFIDDRFYYGMSLKNVGQYNESVEQLNQFIEFSTIDSLKPQAQLAIKGMVDASKLEENIGVEVKFAGESVNSPFVEYSPRYFNGDLYYSAIPSRKVLKLEGDEKESSRIFVSSRGEDGSFSKGEDIGKNVNRPGVHTGNMTFSRDGRTMYFTRSILFGDEIDQSILYYSNWDGEEWGAANELTSITSEYLITQPAIGEIFAEEVLFFVSDMPGGQGGMDIWYSTRRGDNNFSAPINLGSKINTSGDEITPFYHQGKLYFSSNGKPTIGGFDIFSAEWNGSTWIDIHNIGLNYNTTYDDFGISFDEAGQKGFLVSNRLDDAKKTLVSKTCCDDIYAFNIRDIVIDLIAMVNGEEGPLSGATVTLTDTYNANPPNSKDNEDANDFQFLLDQDMSYVVIADHPLYFPDTIEVGTAGIFDDFTIKKTITLDRDPNAKMFDPNDPNNSGGPGTGDGTNGSDGEPEYETIYTNQPIRLNNIYYDFDDYKILKDAEKDLNVLLALMQEYPNLVIELSSHTDAQGKQSYNRRLSQRRANSAKQYLVGKGVSPDRIKAVGLGETMILNRCVDGVKCSDEEHRFNRRTEFKILSGPTSIRMKREVLRGAKKVNSSFEKRELGNAVPIIQFEKDTIHLGEMKQGDVVEFELPFTNVGDEDLIIDLVTACKCSELDWPKEPIKPNGKGTIKVKFDSTDFHGEVLKVIDIIANTEPIVVEGVFTAVIR